MTIKRKQYSSEDLEATVKLLREGIKMKNVLVHYPSIPERIIRYRVRRLDDLQRPGPQPILGDLENDLEAWVVAMQSQGYPVTRDMILLKGNELYQAMFGKRTSPRTRRTLKRGWLDRFMKRHPLLSLRSAQGIKRVRAEASIEGLTAFFWELSKHLLERNIVDAERVFNMAETGFG